MGAAASMVGTTNDPGMQSVTDPTTGQVVQMPILKTDVIVPASGAPAQFYDTTNAETMGPVYIGSGSTGGDTWIPGISNTVAALGGAVLLMLLMGAMSGGRR
jgi:hypothetical protein